MGMDITMHITNSNGSVIKRDNIYDGRNSEWFNQLMHHCCDDAYDNLDTYSGIPENANSQIVKDKEWTFGHHYISVGEYKKWFEKYRPDIDAGWVTTRDKWLYERKGIIPILKYELSEEDIPADMHFIEVEEKYDNSKWVYNYLIKNEDILDEDLIVYYFDN